MNGAKVQKPGLESSRPISVSLKYKILLLQYSNKLLDVILDFFVLVIFEKFNVPVGILLLYKN